MGCGRHSVTGTGRTADLTAPPHALVISPRCQRLGQKNFLAMVFFEPVVAGRQPDAAAGDVDLESEIVRVFPIGSATTEMPLADMDRAVSLIPQ
jgi:hypothetical protein